jgi:hypothetical protein
MQHFTVHVGWWQSILKQVCGISYRFKAISMQLEPMKQSWRNLTYRIISNYAQSIGD